MEKSKSERIYKIIMLVFITIIITSLVTAFATYQYLSSTELLGGTINKDSSLSGLEYTLSKFRSEFQKKYLGEIDDKKLIEGAIKGYVSALGDPYTTYYTKEEMESVMEETNGNFVGIGIYMITDKEKNTVTVLKPIEDSPAEKAGILTGDIIKKVDGVECSGDKIDDVSDMIRGEEGTKVKIEVLRGEETKTFEIKRAKVLVSHISTKVLKDKIGYIQISDFEGGVAAEFEKKYKELEKQGITKLIIDIRDNGGGIVDEAIKIADTMIEKGKDLLITKDKNNNEEITKAKTKPIITMPVVLLTNSYSASASEILAGILKDYKRATIVGTTTYGKGIIQELHQLTDGSGLKITTNEYVTPSRNTIHKVGIKPDIEIDLSDEAKAQTVLTEDKDNQLQKAIEVVKSL